MVAPQIPQEKKEISEFSMEKQPEGGLMVRGRDVCERRGLLSLCFYAGAVTAALIVVIALGTVYQQQTQDMHQKQQHQTKEMCQTQQELMEARCAGKTEAADPEDEDGESKHVKVKNDKTTEDDDVIKSKNGRFETVFSRHENASHPVITVVDHKRGLTGIYFPPTGECYLMGGRPIQQADPAEESTAVSKDTMNDDESPSFDVLYDEEITDKTMLPGQLQDVCRDKKTYWVQRHTTGEHQRQKRGIYSYRVCFNYSFYSSCIVNGVYFRPCKFCLYVQCSGPTAYACQQAVCAKYGISPCTLSG